ncbi:MAG: four helix bundle protein [Candidatus Roizmanbacteria bacterium]
MKINNFEELVVWQKARELTLEIYTIFSTIKDYGFKDQIQRASISVMNNIAEGFERKGDKEFSRFLFIAKGSIAEVRSMLYVSKDMNYISESIFNKLQSKSIEISRMTYGLIKSINN